MLARSVHPHESSLHLSRCIDRLFEFVGEDVGRQTVGTCIDPSDHVVAAAPAEDRQHWPEHFFASEPRCLVHSVEHRRLEEETTEFVARWRTAAACYETCLHRPFLHERLDAPKLFSGHERAHICRVAERIANLQRLELGSDRCHAALDKVLVDVQTRGRPAGLTLGDRQVHAQHGRGPRPRRQ